MPIVVTTQVLQLGQHARLDTNKLSLGADNARALVNQTFGSADNPLWGTRTTMTINDGNSDGTVPFIGLTTPPRNEFITVGGTNRFVDSGIAYNASFTYSDGTTGTGVIRILQDQHGSLFALPPPRTASQSEIDAVTRKPITSFRLTSISTNNFTGLVSDRFGLPDDPTFPCFCKGTMIQTEEGEKPVEDLRVGDRILTKENGFQTLRWIGSRLLSAADLGQNDKLKPIRIRAGALGPNIPSSDLMVSPQHRILVRSRIALTMFGTEEVLVAAKQLLQIEGVEIAEDAHEVEYFHLLFDRHEIVISNGTETESLYLGPEALKSVGAAARAEIIAIFPEIEDLDFKAIPARALISGRQGRQLAMRHCRNGRELVS